MYIYTYIYIYSYINMYTRIIRALVTSSSDHFLTWKADAVARALPSLTAQARLSVFL